MKNQLAYGKISLRAIEPDDIELLYRWENDMELWEVSNTKAPFSKHILAQYIAESAKDIYETKQLRLIIQDENLIPVGAVDIFDFDPFHARAGIGILIHRKTDQNRGFASDTLIAITQYSINILGLKQLYANISADNLNSLKLFEKSGFKRVGIKKDWIKTFPGWKDEILYQKILA